MTLTIHPGPRSSVWAELEAHAARLTAVPVRELFDRDPGRFERFSRLQADLLMDFSRQRLDEIALDPLDAIMRSFFIKLHQAAVAGNIGGHDGC